MILSKVFDVKGYSLFTMVSTYFGAHCKLDKYLKFVNKQYSLHPPSMYSALIADSVINNTVLCEQLNYT